MTSSTYLRPQQPTIENRNDKKQHSGVRLINGEALETMGRSSSFRLIKTKKSTKNNIPLPPSQGLGQGRARTESMSSYVDSVISAPGRSHSVGRPVPSVSNVSNVLNVSNGRSKSAGRSISARSRSSRSRRSTSSKTSKSNSKVSTSSPRFLPWAFSGVTSRLLPSDLEISDYDHSVLLNRQSSDMEDSVSTLKDESEGGSSGNEFAYRTNTNMNMFVSPMVKDQPLTMDTIHSSYTAKHQHPDHQYPNMNSQYSNNQYPNSQYPNSPQPRSVQRRVRHRPPLHQHSRSHSADFVDFLQKDSLLSKKLASPNEIMAQDYGAVGDTDHFRRTEKHSNKIHTNTNVEMEPLLRHQTEPLNRTTSTTMTRSSNRQYDLSGKRPQYDLSKQFDLYEEEINIPELSPNWGSSRVSLLDQHSAGFAKPEKRSFRRRVFLLLTEPQTSYLSLMFFTIYFVMLLTSVIVMMMQTMTWFQYTPSDCEFCSGDDVSPTGYSYPSISPSPSATIMATDDTVFNADNRSPNVACVCAPIPVPQIVHVEDWIIYYFSVEWIVRVLCYVPLKTENGEHRSFFAFLVEPYTILDFFATFPYYLIRYHQIEGIVSLRLLRFFRVFQLLRLKKYDIYITTMIRVLMNSLQALHIYVLTLLFLAAVFGSVIYWFEKGIWKYTDLLEEPGYAFVRKSADGITEELSPFHSIPGSFWWFFVTATTAGYGDAYPTSACGKIVAVFALLCSVLVIAFPVSIFSELWQKELHAIGELKNLYNESDEDEEDFEDDISFQSSQEEEKAPVKFVSTTSSHNFIGSENSSFPLDASNSFTSMIQQTHDDRSHMSVNSMVKTGSNDLSHSESDSSSSVKFTAKDATDLRRYVESIEEAQQKIRKILNKLERS